MKSLLLRVLITLPWLGLIWFVSLGFTDHLNLLLVIILTIIFIPLAMVFNLLTYIAFHGASVITAIRRMQKSRDIGNERLESENYADLPWWHPKKRL